MIITFYVISIILFIAAFGVHSIIRGQDPINQPSYISTPLTIIPWIGAFVLPIISEYYFFKYNLFALFILNLAFVYIVGPFITRFYLKNFSSGILGKDLLYSFILGLLCLNIAILSAYVF